MPLSTRPLTWGVMATLLSVASFGHAGRADPVMSAAPPDAVYCSGCLCDDEPPPMDIPGAWQLTGGTLGGRPVLKFMPLERHAARSATCGRSSSTPVTTPRPSGLAPTLM
jgi:hypothetical protein